MRRRDLFLIGGLLLLSLALFGLSCLRQSGTFVVVRVDGMEVGRYSLEADGVYPLNGGSNVLVIEDGCAYLSDANCPDKLCVKQGRVSRDGQVITCLPNRLTVTVYGEADGVDAYL